VHAAPDAFLRHRQVLPRTSQFRATGHGINKFWACLVLLALDVFKRILYLRDQNKWENDLLDRVYLTYVYFYQCRLTLISV